MDRSESHLSTGPARSPERVKRGRTRCFTHCPSLALPHDSPRYCNGQHVPCATSLKDSNEIVAVLRVSAPSSESRSHLRLLQSSKRHLRAYAGVSRVAGALADSPGMYFFGFSRYSKSVSSDHVTPFLPVISRRPMRTDALDVRLGVREALDLTGLATEQTVKAATISRRSAFEGTHLGPTLLPPPFSTVWHWAQRVLNSEAPLAASPFSKPMVDHR